MGVAIDDVVGHAPGDAQGLGQADLGDAALSERRTETPGHDLLALPLPSLPRLLQPGYWQLSPDRGSGQGCGRPEFRDYGVQVGGPSAPGAAASRYGPLQLGLEFLHATVVRAALRQQDLGDTLSGDAVLGGDGAVGSTSAERREHGSDAPTSFVGRQGRIVASWRLGQPQSLDPSGQPVLTDTKQAGCAAIALFPAVGGYDRIVTGPYRQVGCNASDEFEDGDAVAMPVERGDGLGVEERGWPGNGSGCRHRPDRHLEAQAGDDRREIRQRGVLRAVDELVE